MSEERSPLRAWAELLGEPVNVPLTAGEMDRLVTCCHLALDACRALARGEEPPAYVRAYADNTGREGYLTEAEWEGWQELADRLIELVKARREETRPEWEKAKAYMESLREKA